jgi:D-alanine-D-alanine ligase
VKEEHGMQSSTGQQSQQTPGALKEQFKGRKIGVLMGGLSSEREISRRTGAAILKALQDKGYAAVAIDVDRDVVSRLQAAAIEAAFIALHGTLGEDGVIQGLLELLQIPYTGSGVLASALAMNKVAAKKIFVYHGLPTPEFQSLRVAPGGEGAVLSDITISCPMIVKPAEEGSTIGVSIVRTREELRPALETAAGFGSELLIEAFITGRELTVGILNDRPLPLIEIIPRSGFYDYQAKYQKGETDYVFPDWLGARREQEIQSLAVQAFQSLGCSGAARVDFMIDRDYSALILEVNTVPGMTETSLLPKAARRAGIEFPELVERILWSAAVHKHVPPSA